MKSKECVDQRVWGVFNVQNGKLEAVELTRSKARSCVSAGGNFIVRPLIVSNDTGVAGACKSKCKKKK